MWLLDFVCTCVASSKKSLYCVSIQGLTLFCPAISCPAFSDCALYALHIWSVIFMPCNFMSCNFDGPPFSCPAFQSTPLPSISQYSGGYLGGPCAWAPLDVKKYLVLMFNVNNMLNFEHFWKCTPEMYPRAPLQIYKYTVASIITSLKRI